MNRGVAAVQEKSDSPDRLPWAIHTQCLWSCPANDLGNHYRLAHEPDGK